MRTKEEDGEESKTTHELCPTQEPLPLREQLRMPLQSSIPAQQQPFLKTSSREAAAEVGRGRKWRRGWCGDETVVAHPSMVLGGHGHGHGQGQAGVWCVPWKKKMRCGFWNITSGWPGSVYKRTNLTF